MQVGFLVKRGELLKHMYGGSLQSPSTPPPRQSYNAALSTGGGGGGIPPPHRGIIFGVICWSCGKQLMDGFFCASCRCFGFKCVICNIAVRGLSNFCINCGHGGHSFHMAHWFQRENYCPAGCGCKCVMDNPLTHEPLPDPLSLPSHHHRPHRPNSISNNNTNNNNTTTAITTTSTSSNNLDGNTNNNHTMLDKTSNGTTTNYIDINNNNNKDLLSVPATSPRNSYQTIDNNSLNIINNNNTPTNTATMLHNNNNNNTHIKNNEHGSLLDKIVGATDFFEYF